MRPGDTIFAVDGWRVGCGAVVEDVRNRLRGDPGSTVDITIENLIIPKTVVQIADVKLAVQDDELGDLVSTIAGYINEIVGRN